MSPNLTEWARCPVCAAASRRDYVEFPQLAFARCDGCGTIYKTRELAQLLSADFYEQGYFHGRKSGRDKRFEHRVRKAQRWIRALLRFAPRGSSLIDIGCSFGYVIEAGKRLGLRSAGLDVSEYAVKTCVERGYDARVGTLQKMPFDDASFDVCVMKHVIEHTADPASALAEVKRILSPDGLVLIAVPDSSYWKGAVLRKSYRYYRPDDLGAQHYVYYSRASLRSLLERHGFEVLADGKDHWPRGGAGPGRLVAGLEFLFLRAGYAAVRALRLQRELFFVARLKQ